MIELTDSNSTRPYLIRALHEWCSDNGLTPFLSVAVDASVSVPNEYVRNDEIVLNVSYGATERLSIGNDYIEFRGRFGGIARDVFVPVGRVVAIYARENGQGLVFQAISPSVDMEHAPREAGVAALAPVPKSTDTTNDATEVTRPLVTGRPTLTRIK